MCLHICWLMNINACCEFTRNNSPCMFCYFLCRGNPGIQSNSIYALAGLAVTINRYGSNLDKESLEVAEGSTEYLSHSHWLTVVMDTIMCLADVNHKPKGSLLGLCQQVYT